MPRGVTKEFAYEDRGVAGEKAFDVDEMSAGTNVPGHYHECLPSPAYAIANVAETQTTVICRRFPDRFRSPRLLRL